MDGIIFDIDGTLWDSTEVVAEAWNLAIAEKSNLELVLTGERLKEEFGKPMKEIVEDLLPGVPEEEQERLSKECYQYENELLAKKPGKLYPKVKEVIEKLAGTYPLYIVSNCQCGYIEVCIEGTGLKPYIKDFACYGDNGLPKAENLKRLIKRNGLKSPVYIGDTAGDAAACKEAGIPMVYAAYGFGEVTHPEYQIETFEELLSFFQVEK